MPNNMRKNKRFNALLWSIALFLLAAIFINPLTPFRQALQSVQVFRKCGFQFENLRQYNYDKNSDHWDMAGIKGSWWAHNTTYYAKRVIPPGSRVWFSHKGWDGHIVHMRYDWYPTQHEEKDWDYYVDLLDSFYKNGDADPSWSVLRLPTDKFVYAKPGHPFLSLTEPKLDQPTEPYTILVFLAIAATEMLVGLLLLIALRIPSNRGGALWYLSTAYLLGMSLCTAIVWAYLLIGFRLSIPSVVALWAGLAAFLVLVARRGIARGAARSVFSRQCWKQNLPTDYWGWGVFVFAVCYLVAYTIPVFLSFVYAWDAQSHWIFKSKVILEHRQLVFSETHHNIYPLLWSLKHAIHFLFVQGDHDEIVKWTVGLLLFVFAGQLLGGLSLLAVNRDMRAIFVILFFALLTESTFRTAYAEAMFLCALTAVIVSLLAWIHYPEEHRYLFLAGTLGIVLVLTKLEGSPCLGILAVSLFLTNKRWVSLRSIGLLILLCLPILTEVGWISWLNCHGFEARTDHFKPTSIANLWPYTKALLDTMAGRALGYRVFAGIALTLLLFASHGWERPHRFLTLAALGLFLFGALSAFGHDSISVNILLGIIPRQMLHVAPVLLLLVASFSSLACSRVASYAIGDIALSNAMQDTHEDR